MRIIKLLLLLIIILILIVGIVGFIFIKTFDANQYRDQIAQWMTTSIGRPVSLESLELAVAIREGLSLYIKGIQMDQDPQTATGNMVSIEKIRMNILLEPFLFKREIHVSAIEAVSPHIRLIRLADQKRKSAALAQPVSQESTDLAEEDRKRVEGGSRAESGQSAFPLLGVAVKNFRITDGLISYEDKTQEAFTALKISNIDVKIQDFQLQEWTDFVLKAAFLSSRQNIDLKGSLRFDLEQLRLQFEETHLQIDLGFVSIDQLQETFPALSACRIKDNWAGDLSISIVDSQMTLKGLSILDARGSLSKGFLNCAVMPFALENISANFLADQKDFKLKNFQAITLAQQQESGEIAASGTINDYLKDQVFRLDLDLKKLNCANLIPQSKSEVKVEGFLSGNYQLSGEGLSSETIFNLLKGQGTFSLESGKLKNINVLKEVFQKMSVIPGLAEDLEQNLSETYKEKLKATDTIIKENQFITSVQGRNLNIEEFRVSTDSFELRGEGALDLERQIKLRAALQILPELSTAMVQTVEELDFIRESNGRITFPVVIQGQIPQLSYRPDVEYLGQNIFKNRGKQELKKLLGDVLGTDKEKQQKQADSQDDQSDPDRLTQPESSAEEKLVDDLLDMIFN